MRLILDTNIFVSGIFFNGPPAMILAGWRDGRIQVIVSESILEEYRSVGARLAAGFRGIDIEPFMRLISLTATLYRTPALPSLATASGKSAIPEDL